MYNSHIVVVFKDGTKWLEDLDFLRSTSAPETTVMVTEGMTLFSLSYRFYQTHGYWDIIGKRNNILNPFELEPGTLLIIPDHGSLPPQ